MQAPRLTPKSVTSIPEFESHKLPVAHGLQPSLLLAPANEQMRAVLSGYSKFVSRIRRAQGVFKY